MTEKLLQLHEKPVAKEVYMIAGWRQWADAGAISSGLPQYLLEHTDARQIGEILPDNFYMFQVPGTHHFLRPVIRLKDGYRQGFEVRENQFYYTGNEEKGLVIFLGDEPHMNVEQYGEVFFTAVRELNVKRVICVGGVYGAMPFDRDRQVSCIYSLPHMKEEIEQYAVNFSDYEGGATIGAYLVHQAEAENIEMLDFYAFVPSYDFAQSAVQPQGLRIENDFKAWYDLLRRFNHMFDLGLDLTTLEQQSYDLIVAMEAKIDELAREAPQLNVEAYMAELDTEFTELSFAPLADVWDQELDDLFGNADE